MPDSWMLLTFVAAGLVIALFWFAEHRFWKTVDRLDRKSLIAIGALAGMALLGIGMVVALRSDPGPW